MAQKLFLKEIRDRYIQENFKRIQRNIESLQDSASSNTKVVNNNTVQRIPLDGSEPISGTLLPDLPSTHNIGSETLPLKELHADEVFVGPNSLYIDGKQAVGIDQVTGRLTYTNEENEDLEVKSKGTGKLYIDSEGDIVITSSGTVTINGNAVANYNFDRDLFEIPTQVINGNQIVLSHEPIEFTERVVLNGLELTDGASYDYTRSANVITFNSGVLTPDGLIKVDYAYN